MITKLKELVQEDSEEYSIAQQIDKTKVPVHVAVIMDGNGRWAQKNGLKREEGHKEGAVSAKKITEYALRCGVRYLTLFAFSSENWKRPVTEVNTLMNMLYQNLVEQIDLLVENDIKFGIIGDLGRLPGKLRKKLQETIDISKDHKSMQLNLALNYGSRMELIHAVKQIIADNIPAKKIDEALFSNYEDKSTNGDPKAHYAKLKT